MECLFVLFSLFSFPVLLQAGTTRQYREDYEYNAKTDAFYKLHIETTTAILAQDMCNLEGAKLMVPVSKYDIMQAHSMLKRFPDIGDNVWIGEDGQQHESAEEVPLINLQPTDGNIVTYVCEVITRKGEIETYPGCYYNLPFICKVQARDAVFDSQCKVYALGYQYFASAGSCYKVPSLALTWDQAFAECKSEGAHLAVINSQLEHDTIKDVLNTAVTVTKAKTSYFFYAGIRAKKPVDDTPREFRTIFNETLQQTGYDVWSEGEPNNHDNSEYCGTIFKNNGNYNDVDCNDAYAFICETEVHT